MNPRKIWLLVLGVLLGACAAQPGPSPAVLEVQARPALAKTWQVPISRLRPTHTDPRSGLTFTLVGIDEGRCPRPLACVWSGNAAVEFTLRPGGPEGAAPEKTYTLNTALHPTALYEAGVHLRLKEVYPYPQADAEKPADQGAVLELSWEPF